MRVHVIVPLRAALVSALLLLISPATSMADIIEVDLSGGLGGGVFGTFFLNGVDVPESSLAGESFTATLTFDTSKGVFSSPSPALYELSGFAGLDGTMFIPGVGIYGNFAGDAILRWNTE